MSAEYDILIFSVIVLYYMIAHVDIPMHINFFNIFGNAESAVSRAYS
jgi:hypothetical protein